MSSVYDDLDERSTFIFLVQVRVGAIVVVVWPPKSNPHKYCRSLPFSLYIFCIVDSEKLSLLVCSLVSASHFNLAVASYRLYTYILYMPHIYAADCSSLHVPVEMH